MYPRLQYSAEEGKGKGRRAATETSAAAAARSVASTAMDCHRLQLITVQIVHWSTEIKVN
ncbi:hypothetical protein TYRP_009358 [Tyrophagus putrescentiae]|nr:hypothetical protein TYRP_009358 [Tyrophagus putrescentiae]